ncbi:glycosyltransferase family 2 protein [Salinarchaeum laminariae]|uniref:glycosyltransferase family 2 protein n=1 Tax=Salinarchaeum laminariae TaxID=869888 RepID=UPI0020C140FC|nr:glycosyltransferase family 2 protein [Salinarchaeum laminariae]
MEREHRTETIREENPLVSVVVPTYRRNDHLRQCLEAVHEQTYDEVDVIVVDDSGDEHASGVVSSFDDVEYISLSENSGPTAARNIGIKAAEGAYVQLLDDDDYLRREKLERQVNVLDDEEDVGVAYCGFTYGKRNVRPPEKGRGDVLQTVLEHNLPECVTSGMLIEAAQLETIHPLPQTPGSDDTYWKIELAQRTEFEYIDDILLDRQQPDDSRSGSWGAVEGTYDTLERYEDLYEEFPDDVRQRARAHAMRREANYLAENNFWSGRAITLAVRSLQVDPDPVPVHYALPVAYSFGRLSWAPSRLLFRKLLQ